MTSTTQPITDNINQTLNELLNFVKDGSQTAVAFGKEQIPLVVQEILVWGKVEAVLAIIGSIFLLSVGLAFIYWTYKKFEEWDDDHNIMMIFGPLVSVLCSIFGSIFLIASIHALCYTIFAPRLYLIDKITEMINGKH